MKLWSWIWHIYFAYYLIIEFGQFDTWKYWRTQNLWVESYNRKNRDTIKQEALRDAWWCLK